MFKSKFVFDFTLGKIRIRDSDPSSVSSAIPDNPGYPGPSGLSHLIS
jgi:hypothetical protein